MTKVNVELSIGEVHALIQYCNRMADGIPKEAYDKDNLAGTTMGDTAKKYKRRADELTKILDETWPK